jgi:hypothetical protein
VGCPSCQREYLIDQGVVRFGPPPPHTSTSLPDADTLPAVLNISSPGGNVVLVGSAAQLARDLQHRLEGVHIVGINAPATIHDGSGVSLLENSSSIPLRTAMARGVVLGPEYIAWGPDAVRVLLPGLRLAVLSERFESDGMELLATGRGMWVGKKASSVVRG